LLKDLPKNINNIALACIDDLYMLSENKEIDGGISITDLNKKFNSNNFVYLS